LNRQAPAVEPGPYILFHDESVNFGEYDMAKQPSKPTPRDSGKNPSSIAGRVLGGAKPTATQARILAASVLSQNQKP
jgi:hypothetical protein